MEVELRPEARQSVKQEGVSLGAIFGLFFQIGLMSFGGGLSAWIYREVVERRRWLAAQDLLSGLALGQVLPGINVANLSIYVGQRLRGVIGSATALVGLLSAPFFLIIGLATIYARIATIPWLHALLCGMAAAAMGLVLSVAIKSVRQTMRGLAPLSVLAAVVLTVGVLRWPMVPVVLCAAPVSVWLAWRREGSRAG